MTMTNIADLWRERLELQRACDQFEADQQEALTSGDPDVTGRLYAIFDRKNDLDEQILTADAAILDDVATQLHCLAASLRNGGRDVTPEGGSARSAVEILAAIAGQLDRLAWQEA